MRLSFAFRAEARPAEDKQGELFAVPRRRLFPLDPGPEENDLFTGGPPMGLQRRLGLVAPGRPNIRFRALLAAFLCWGVPALLTAVQDALLRDGSFLAFLTDYATLARSLIAVPLLVLIEALCFPRLNNLVRHFRDGGLVRDSGVGGFRAAMHSTRALRDSLWLEIAIFAFAVALVMALNWTLPPAPYQSWHRIAELRHSVYSPAGLWNALVAVPLALMLVLGWLWRLALWTRFLWLVSRLELRLIPSHPDGAGGLLFVGLSAQMFSVLAFALGAIVSGAVVNQIVYEGATLMTYRYVVAGFVVLCIALFAGPLLVFGTKLLGERRRGILQYGALARSVGAHLEDKWLRHRERTGADSLDANDFSATTDLNSIAANVYAMRVLPVSWVSLVLLVCGALLPFLPALLLSVPADVLLGKLTTLFV